VLYRSTVGKAVVRSGDAGGAVRNGSLGKSSGGAWPWGSNQVLRSLVGRREKTEDRRRMGRPGAQVPEDFKGHEANRPAPRAPSLETQRLARNAWFTEGAVYDYVKSFTRIAPQTAFDQS